MGSIQREKIGKSKTGAVWLNENLTSPYDFWQFWRNTEDKDVIKFLKLFTELPLNEIEKLGKLKGYEKEGLFDSDFSDLIKGQTLWDMVRKKR